MWGRQDVETFIAQYGQEIFCTCRAILGNDKDAEDAVTEVTVKLLKNPPKEPVKHPKAYLRQVARNTALDLQRKRQKTREVLSEGDLEPIDPMAADAFRAFRIRLDAPKFLDRISAMLGESRQEDVALCFDALLNRYTISEQAERLGLSERQMKNRRKQAVNAVRKAATVVALITDPGDEPNRCEAPFRLSLEKTDSPDLLREVEAHIRRCEPCERRCADRNGLRGVVLAISGMALGGEPLHRLLAASRFAKVSAAAGVGVTAAMVATVFLTPVTRIPDLGQAPPPRPTLDAHPAPSGTTQMPTTTTPSSPSSPPTATTSPAIRPTAPPSTSTYPEPPSLTSTAPTTDGPAGGSGRNDSAPAVTGSWVQHRHIAAADDGTCGDEPTSSDVGVTVTPGATSAAIVLTVLGRTVSLPMRGADGGTRWAGSVGPVRDENARTNLGVAVEVVGTNGARTVKSLGKIYVCPCRSGE